MQVFFSKNAICKGSLEVLLIIKQPHTGVCCRTKYQYDCRRLKMHGCASKTPGMFLKRCSDINGQVQSLRIVMYRSSHSSNLRLHSSEREIESLGLTGV